MHQHICIYAPIIVRIYACAPANMHYMPPYLLASMHICQHICIDASIYAYDYAYIPAYTETCIYACIYAHTPACMHICSHKWSHICPAHHHICIMRFHIPSHICIYASPNACMYAYMPASVNICIYAHISFSP